VDRKNPVHATNYTETRISVIISTRNRRELLESCLESLACQTLPLHLFEVVIVNDGSTDSTQDFLESYRLTSRFKLNVLSQVNVGVSASRNRGIFHAKSSIIAFTDDDCILSSDWLARLLLSWEIAGNRIAGIGGPLNTVTTGPVSFTSRFIHHLDEFNYIPVLTAWYIKPVHVSCLQDHEIIPYLRTSNASFRKKCVDEIGGFDASFKQPGGEDPDLCYRLMKCGYSFHFDKELVVNHNSRVSLASYFKSLRNYAIGDMKKSFKRDQYPEAVARCYRTVLLQKAASCLVSVIKLPFDCVRFSCDSKNGNVLFPFITCIAKMYAISVSCKFYLHCRLDGKVKWRRLLGLVYKQ
jgi:glycosyltransferase involved in cell wall biosynthesis